MFTRHHADELAIAVQRSSELPPRIAAAKEVTREEVLEIWRAASGAGGPDAGAGPYRDGPSDDDAIMFDDMWQRWQRAIAAAERARDRGDGYYVTWVL